MIRELKGNLKAQISEFNTIFVDSIFIVGGTEAELDFSYFRRMKELSFKKNYLASSLSEEEAKMAERNVQEYERNFAKKQVIEFALFEKLNLVDTQKEPRLFKKKFVRKMEKMKQEIEDLEIDQRKTIEQLTEMKAAMDEAEKIIMLLEGDKREINRRYEEDEKQFERKKKELFNEQGRVHCNVPSEHAQNGPYDKIKEWFKNFLCQTSAGKVVFNEIGWDHALMTATFIFMNFKNWKGDGERITIDGHTNSMANVMLLFLSDYIDNDRKNHTKPEYLMIKILVNQIFLDMHIQNIKDYFELDRLLGNILENIKKPENSLHYKSNLDFSFKQYRESSDNPMPEFRNLIRETWSAIENGKNHTVEEQLGDYFRNVEKDFMGKFGFLERTFCR